MAVFISDCPQADTFKVSWDNDLLLGQDAGYTNGLRFSYLTASADDSKSGSAGIARAAAKVFSDLPGISQPAHQQAVAFNVQQLMFTPEDITSKEANYDDLPYAGYLSVGSTLWSLGADTITGYGVHLGIVGPGSGAAASQKWVHKIIGSELPAGWDNQIGTDVVGGILATHARKFWQSDEKNHLEQQLSWVSSAALSSFSTYAGVGSVWRIGENLPLNFLANYANASSSSSLPAAENGAAQGWSVFIGVGLEYVAYYYLEANAGPYQLDESPLLLHAGIGATWQWRNLQAALTLRATTSDEKSNKDDFNFGTLSLTWTY